MSVATTGKPQAMASTTATGKPSVIPSLRSSIETPILSWKSSKRSPPGRSAMTGSRLRLTARDPPSELISGMRRSLIISPMAGIDRLVRALTKKTFPLFERMGVHVTPVHYYGPVPDTRELRPELWSSTSELVGVDLAEDRQLQLLADFRVRFKTECDALPLDGTG